MPSEPMTKVLPDTSSPYQSNQTYNEAKPVVPFRRKLSSKLNGYQDDQGGPSKPSSRQARNRAAPADIVNQNGYGGPSNSNNAYSKPM